MVVDVVGVVAAAAVVAGVTAVLRFQGVQGSVSWRPTTVK